MTVPGAILQGRYRIDEQLRQGGMGTVFKARDMRLSKEVAVKSSRLTEERLRKQFELEAQLLAVLRHPALPIVIDHFKDDDELFLVMDYIEGDDLGEILASRKAPFPLEDVLTWADQLLDALVFMHGQSPPIIHRDIKPQNLKLTARKQIILLDFGLAKGSLSSEMEVTTSGSIFGYTPHYASLEQRQGTGTDARSDLYSLGATLYHLLSAKLPVDASTRAAAVINGEPDPLLDLFAANPDISPAVSGVVAKAMALRRESRPASAAEMRLLLRDAAQAAHNIPPTISDATPIHSSAPPAHVSAPPLRGLVNAPHASLDSVTTRSTPPAPVTPPTGKELSATVMDQSLSIPSKIDHAFYGGLLLGGASAAIMIASLVFRLGAYGGAAWLISLTLTGAFVAGFYVLRSSAPVRPSDVLQIGAIAGAVSAVVQWLLLVTAYFANLLNIDAGSGEALLLLVCLLGLLVCLSPLTAFVAVRSLTAEKLAIGDKHSRQ